MSTTPSPPTTPAVTDPAPVFLEGPSAKGATEPPAIGVPAAPTVATITTKANYRSTISPADTCLVAGVDTGTRDHGDEPRQRPQRSAASPTACTPTGANGIVLHTDTFAQIADLTDAPIPVDITS